MIKQLKYTYRAYRFRYKLDQNEINYLVNHLKPGDIAVDIGAHKGAYLYWMRHAIKEKGTAFAFEPQVKLYHYLTSVYSNPKHSNTTIENMGVSNQTGEVSFYIPTTLKGDSPGARIDRLVQKAVQETTIKTTTLDQYFLERNIHPNLIKIDVEGHEKQVIEGGIKLLQTAQPTLIVECENRHLRNSSVADVFQLLTDIGYKGFFFLDNKQIPLEEFDLSIHQKNEGKRFWEAKDYINNFIFEKEQ